MIPPKVDESISIGIDKLLRYAEPISPEIAGKVNVVIIVDLIVELGIEIIKTCGVVYVDYWQK